MLDEALELEEELLEVDPPPELTPPHAVISRRPIRPSMARTVFMDFDSQIME